jgi:predicted RNase H-like HicB family nuclease
MLSTKKSKSFSKNPAKARKARASDDPRVERQFDQDILKRAREIAAHYRVAIEAAGSEFVGWSLEMPGVLAEGSTPEECVKEMYKALEFTVATLLAEGERPPTPYSEQENRTSQINVRVTPEEKETLEQTSRRRGFKGVSDFVRFVALHESAAK